jgi:hypothetical protein
MFDFIKKIFKKEPQKEQVVEVEVKAKRKYKPRAPKTEDTVEEAVVAVIEPIVIAEAPVEPVRPRIMARQLVGAATPQPTPVVEAVVQKAPVKKKPAAKKPVAKVEKPVEVSAVEPVNEIIAPVVEPVVVKVEQAVVKSVPKKPDNKPKAVQNKPPRGKKKKR